MMAMCIDLAVTMCFGCLQFEQSGELRKPVVGAVWFYAYVRAYSVGLMNSVITGLLLGNVLPKSKRFWMRRLVWTGVGIHWDNLLEPINEDNQFSMADVYIMLSANISIHSLIFWYMDALLPGDFGMPKPVYFPFTVVTIHFTRTCITTLRSGLCYRNFVCRLCVCLSVTLVHLTQRVEPFGNIF